MPVHEHKIFPDEFPEEWASDWGEDEYGLWMGFTYKGVRQDFRWIEPGTFMMGSPEGELGRGRDETLHEVILTNGFWMADTTVIQALWIEVMGDNPSRFKGGNRPVDSVTWREAQQFITRMNGLKAELKLRLPSEAEWEYCCRAGTMTAFHFGSKDDLSLNWVNYSGDWENWTPNGESRAVKSYAPNNWGLYEMHGNVLEWCQDRYDNYPAKSVIDPVQEQSGMNRVL